MHMAINQRFDSIWDATEATVGEAAVMKARSALMIAISEHIHTLGLTQADAARRLGVTQPRILGLTRGKVDLFSLATLVNMLATAGLRVDMQVTDAANA
jgi:predicted XRE-type DNA-binding protein